jgi:uncharacterized protein (DUF305 family)
MTPAPRTRRARATTAVGAALSLLLVLVPGCGADSGESDSVVGTGPSRRNDADVRFATQMIPHHAQVVAMVNLTFDRKVDSELAMTAEQMLTSPPDTNVLSSWLQDWGKPIPRTMIDHVGHTMGNTSMPGALNKAEFHQLEKTKGADFEQAWLEAMIAHHEGAIQMAKTEQAEGANPAAKRLAGEVVRSQQSELRELRSFLSD